MQQRYALLFGLGLLFFATALAEAEVFTPKIDQGLLLSEAEEAIVHAPTLRDALYFAYLGSAGETRDRLADALGLPIELPDGAVVELQHDGAAAQEVWIQPGYGWLESFGQVTRRDFNFTYQTYDFINANERFGGELAGKEIVVAVTEKTRLLFASIEETSYEWREAPILSKTTPGLFVYGKKGEEVVDFICLLGEFLHYGEEAFQVVGIPLSENRMLFVWLPNELIDSSNNLNLGFVIANEPAPELAEDPAWSLEELQQNLTPAFVSDTVAKMTKRQIEVRLPLVRLRDWNGSPLSELDVVGTHGDFTNVQAGEGSAFIQSIQSEMTLDLNESGVVTSNMAALTMDLAASHYSTGHASLINVGVEWYNGRQALPLEFNADRPHLLMIADDTAEDLVAVASVERIPFENRIKDEAGKPLTATDWASSVWFGWLLNNQRSQNERPWYYHAEHGWIYLPELRAEGTWWYDETLDWSWSSATSMPWIFSYTHGWLWFSGGVAGERSFYSADKADWVLEENLRGE